MKLLGVEKWIENIDQQIDRLKPLDCSLCIPELLEKLKSNNIIKDYTLGKKQITYTIGSETITKEL